MLDAGLPTTAARAVREDPGNRNLVFAAFDAGVFVSFDGGDHWQSLQLNMPAAWCRDLAIEQNTLAAATFGRALWALDDISPLRELASKAAQVASANAYLFPPAPAIRMQWDTYTDTPLNPDVAAARNPPDGAAIDYYLKPPPAGDIRLEIYDAAGALVRSYSSSGETALGYKANVPAVWLAPPPLLPKSAGHNRFVWDLRYPDPKAILFTYYGVHVNYFEYTLADHAIPHNTPWHEPQGPMVAPGTYELRLTVAGQTYRQPLEVKLDPRLSYSTAELQAQLDLARKIAAAIDLTSEAYTQAAAAKLTGLNGAAGPPPGFGPLNRDLARLLVAVDQSDSPPAAALVEAFAALCQDTRAAVGRWNEARSRQSPQPPALQAPDCGK